MSQIHYELNKQDSVKLMERSRSLLNRSADGFAKAGPRLRRFLLNSVLLSLWLAIAIEGGSLAQESTASGNSGKHTLAWTPILESGISVAGVQATLPPPVLSTIDENAGNAAEAKIAELAGSFGLERFTRNNLNAPVRIQIDEVLDADDSRLGYSVHSAYVLHAELGKLKDKTLMASIFGAERDAGDDGSVMRELTEVEVQRLGLESTKGDRNFLWLELPLLNKVVVRGLVEVEKAEAEAGFLLAWRLVDTSAPPQSKWADIARSDGGYFAGTWAKLSTNDLGAKVEGAPQEYSGLGGYVSLKATGLEENQMLVESRMVMHEPADWFSGSRYLRSKLPLSIQSSAKSLRRKLR
ncbi:MAG: hypothetical protein AB8B50_01980 [Pirellulaceae bacterium]